MNALPNRGHKRPREIDAVVMSMKQEFLLGKNQKPCSASLGAHGVRKACVKGKVRRQQLLKSTKFRLKKANNSGQ